MNRIFTEDNAHLHFLRDLPAMTEGSEYDESVFEATDDDHDPRVHLKLTKSHHQSKRAKRHDA